MSNSNNTDEINIKKVLKIFFSCSTFLLILIAFGMWGCPQYNVWEQEMEGKAAYVKAEQNRRIAVLEADAKMSASSKLAEAEVIRASGVAKANKIIGESLNKNELYLHYLWIQNLHEGRNDVIYVPTEAGIPIMEAGKLRNKQ